MNKLAYDRVVKRSAGKDLPLPEMDEDERRIIIKYLQFAFDLSKSGKGSNYLDQREDNVTSDMEGLWIFC